VLSLDPALLILDEPTSMLSPRARVDLLRHHDSLHAGGSSIMHITHDMDEAFKAERIIALDDGRIVYDGDVAGFLSLGDDRLRSLGLMADPASDGARRVARDEAQDKTWPASAATGDAPLVTASGSPSAPCAIFPSRPDAVRSSRLPGVRLGKDSPARDARGHCRSPSRRGSVRLGLFRPSPFRKARRAYSRSSSRTTSRSAPGIKASPGRTW
jgi:hypothetical protein